MSLEFDTKNKQFIMTMMVMMAMMIKQVVGRFILIHSLTLHEPGTPTMIKYGVPSGEPTGTNDLEATMEPNPNTMFALYSGISKGCEIKYSPALRTTSSELSARQHRLNCSVQPPKRTVVGCYSAPSSRFKGGVGGGVGGGMRTVVEELENRSFFSVPPSRLT